MKYHQIAIHLLNILAAFIFCIIVWFGGKHVGIHTISPTTNWVLRLLAVSAVILFWLIKLVLLALNKNAEVKIITSYLKAKNNNLQTEKIKGKNFSRQITKTLKELKKQHFLTDKSAVSLLNLPWYIISGPPGYGKTQLIKNSGLYFPLLKSAVNFGIKDNDDLNFECWVTEDAVFLELSKSKNQEIWDTKSYNAAWLSIIKTLKKYKKNTGISGVIMVVDVSYFMGNEEERKQKIAGTRQHIREIYEQLKCKYPLTIMISKCDKIAGFSEYFETFTPAQLDNALGFILPKNNYDANNFEKILESKFSHLLSKLNGLLPWLLEKEDDLNKKSLITLFPQQLFLFKNRFIDAIRETFIPQKFYELVDLRGIFFTSAQQAEENTYNIMGSITQSQFQLTPINHYNPTKLGQGCFLKNVFKEIIIPDSLDYNKKLSNKSRQIAYKILFFSSITLVAVSIFSLLFTFFNARGTMITTGNYLKDFQNEVSINLTDEYTFQSILAAMKPLKMIDTLYPTDMDSQIFSFHDTQTSRIKSALKQLKIRKLQQYFIPYLTNYLESLLLNSQNKLDTLYSLLKAYLFLENPETLPSNWLTSAMNSIWANDNTLSKDDVADLNQYLQLSLIGLHSQKINQKIVASSIAALKKVPPTNRIYYNIKQNSLSSHLPSLDLDELIGNNSHVIFDINSVSAIPGFYTLAGYKLTFITQLQKDIEDAFSEQTQSIFGAIYNSEGKLSKIQEIRDDVNLLYGLDYVHQWLNVIGQFKIVSFTDTRQAIRVIDSFKEKKSPAYKLLYILKENTNSHIKNTKINETFETLNQYLDQLTTGDNINSLNKLLSNLSLYFRNIEQAPNPNLAAFLSLKATIGSNSKPDPISALLSKADTLPEPLRRWVREIGVNSRYLVMEMAYNYINSEWETQVLEKYKNISGYYPLNSVAEFDLNENDFANFFKKEGILNRFFQTYLKDFINTDQTPWVWRSFEGKSFSPDTNSPEKIHSILKITEYLFPNNAAKLLVNFKVKPLLLSNNAASVNLQIGNQRLTYSHGPLMNTAFSWPVDDFDQIKLRFDGFGGKELFKTFDGSWGLIKFLQASIIENGSDPYHYNVKISFYDYNANLDLIMPNNEILPILMRLDKIQMPNSL